MNVQTHGKPGLQTPDFCGTMLIVKKPYTLGFCHSSPDAVENLGGFASRAAGGVENKKGPARLQSDEAHHLTVGGSHG